MNRTVFACCLLVITLCPDLSMEQGVDGWVPGSYYCHFSSHIGGGRLWVRFGANGLVESAAGMFKTRGHFCRYFLMSEGRYSLVGSDLKALIVLGGERFAGCPLELRAPQIMLSIETGAGAANLDAPVGRSSGQCYRVPGTGE
jgi:hypothetical protein